MEKKSLNLSSSNFLLFCLIFNSLLSIRSFKSLRSYLLPNVLLATKCCTQHIATIRIRFGWTKLNCSSKLRTTELYSLSMKCTQFFPAMWILSWLNRHMWRQQQQPCWVLPPEFTSTCRADILPRQENENLVFFSTLHQTSSVCSGG